MFSRTMRLFILTLLVAAVGAAAPIAGPAAAQTPQQLEALRRNPDLVRERIRASGLSPEEVRARLRDAGLPANLLDPYMPGAAADTTDLGVSAELAQAMDLLGVPVQHPAGLQPIPLEAGSERAEAAPAAPAAARLFGLDVFRGRTTQFQPLLTGPVPPNYRLGPGDVMVLVMTGDVERVHELQVTREGFVVIHQVGQLFVNNLTMEQLNALLRERLGRAFSGIQTGTTRFDVTIARLRTNQVFVIGEVAQPGAYQLASVATVLNALYAAGGPTERANFRRIEVRRRGEAAATLDLYDYLLRGDTQNDVMLEQGDVVFVGVHGTRATLQGAVVRPAIYELRPGQTLAELIEAAGGFRPDAALLRISIARIVPPAQRAANGPDRVVVDVPIAQVVEGRAPPFPIEPGDVVTLFDVPAARRAYVELRGSVYHPGTYGWRPGLRLSELVALAGGFRPAVYAGRAHIERLNPVDSTRFLVEVSLPQDSLKAYPNDAELHEYDVVTIYGREEFREDRTLSVAGMVNRPGSYPYREGMTLRDLVLMARGLRDGAYLDSAEISRLPEDRVGGRLAETFRVPLDSTYLFERDSTTYRFLPGPPVRARGAPEVPLQPYDHALILRQPDFELQRTVTITGEVRFPGRFALRSKAEQLSDLVERAGGLLPTAYAEGARFYRHLDGAGRVDVRLARALDRRRGREDIVLQPGDSLDVPEYVATVRVEGAVVSPATVLYREGAGLDYYIANAGGWARDADKGRVSVRYANGSARTRSKFLFFSGYPAPGPGSVVFVPSKPEGEPFNPTQFFGSLAQILASTVAIVVLVTR